MKNNITLFSGPNRYCMRPVLRVKFNLSELQNIPGLPPRDALVKSLSELLPGFAEIAEGNPSDKIDIAAISLLPSVSLALQNQTGCQLTFQHISRTSDSNDSDDVYESVFEYESSIIARKAASLSFRIIFSRLQHHFGLSLPENFQTPNYLDIKQSIERFVENAAPFELNDSTRDIIRALEKQNIPWHRLDETSPIIQAGYGIHRKLLFETITSETNVPASQISRDKNQTHTFLQHTRFPVPRQAAATTLKEANLWAQSIGYPLVIKPAIGAKGQGITIGIQNEIELPSAFNRAQKISQRVIIETFIAGDDHRFLVVGNKVIAVAKRVPGHVIGNGRNSVLELLNILNSSPDRGKGYGRHYVKIEPDQQVHDCLLEQGLTLSSVPKPEQVVPLRRTANMSTGGTSIDMTDQTHPDNIAMAERAAAVTGLDILGVDFISTDISRSYLENGGGICEINISPGLRPHWFAEGDQSRDVAGAIVNNLFRSSLSKSGLPLMAAITGTNGKTTTCRMVQAILRQAGLFTGMTNSDGIYIDGHLIKKGDSTGIGGARAILSDTRLEAAVLETARGGILKYGIGFSACTVSAVLNITPDHLGSDGIDTLEEMAKIKQLVAKLARNTVVLNADDPLCINMIPQLQERKLSLVTRDSENSAIIIPIANVESVITLVESKKGEIDNIVIRENDVETHVLKTRDIPATFEGLAKYNVDNAMSAIAITHSMGIDLEHIQSGLRKFTSDFDNTPGRANIMYDKAFTVMLDIGNNPEAIRAVGEFVDNMEIDGKRACVLSSPSNRTLDHFTAMAEAAAENFDHIICSNWYDLRGSSPEFVPDEFAKALKNCGFNKNDITICNDPDQSIETALKQIDAEDFLVIFGDRPKRRRSLALERLDVSAAVE